MAVFFGTKSLGDGGRSLEVQKKEDPVFDTGVPIVASQKCGEIPWTNLSSHFHDEIDCQNTGCEPYGR